jgi:hypothetical protein
MRDLNQGFSVGFSESSMRQDGISIRAIANFARAIADILYQWNM